MENHIHGKASAQLGNSNHLQCVCRCGVFCNECLLVPPLSERCSADIHRTSYGVLIPFASLMIPLVKITTVLHINNTLPGAIIVFAGVGLAFGFFMMQSAVKTLPRELEEAAALDGCGPVRTFFCIVFPLMKNTVFSLIAMDLFWVWNDFMIPQTLLNSTKYDTIQVGINKLFGMYASKWDIALAALVMSMIPTIIAFLLLQKQILGGVSDGATKG